MVLSDIIFTFKIRVVGILYCPRVIDHDKLGVEIDDKFDRIVVAVTDSRCSRLTIFINIVDDFDRIATILKSLISFFSILAGQTSI